MRVRPFPLLWARPLVLLIEMATAAVETPKEKKKRKVRVVTKKFDEEKMYEALKPLAQKRHNKFTWDGGLYPKIKRTQGPDKDGLLIHLPVLMPIVEIAQSG